MKLKEIHAATHPARLQRDRGDQGRAAEASIDDAVQTLLEAIGEADE